MPGCAWSYGRKECNALLLTKARIQVAIGIAISLILLLLAFRGVDWAYLLRSLSTVDLGLVVAAILLLIASLVVRALRWRTLLAPLAPAPLADALSYTLIGYLVNNVLPFRLGEPSRAVLLGEKLGTSKAGVFATVVVERLLDVLSLLSFVVVLLAMLDLPPVVRGSILAGEAVAVAAVLALGVLAWQGRSLERLVPHFVRGTIRSRLVALLDGFVQGLQVLKSGRQLLAATAWSLLAWTLFAVSVSCFLLASGLDDLPWYASLLVVVVTNLGSAIPSSPGFVGGYHFLAVFALAFWSVPKGDALSFAILVHGVDYVVITGLGILALWRENIAFGSLRRQVQMQREATAQREAG
jgi:uncharacterized protein (TIRG00374 family)